MATVWFGLVCGRGRSLFAANPANYYLRHEHLLIENHRMWIPMWQKAGRKTRGFPELYGWHYGLRAREVLCQRAAWRVRQKNNLSLGRITNQRIGNHSDRLTGRRAFNRNQHTQNRRVRLEKVMYGRSKRDRARRT